MKKNKLFAVCFALTIALVCGACANTDTDVGTTASTAPEELTAPQIADKMQEALLTTPCSKLETTIVMSYSVDAGESGKMDVSMTNKTETTISQNPVSGYSVATVDMEIAGQNTQSIVESYSIHDGGEMITYVNSSGIWMKVPTGQSAEDFARTASSLTVDPSQLSVDEAVTQWNDRNVIALKYELTGDALQATVDAVLGSMGNMGSILDSTTEVVDAVDYTRMKGTVELYLDPETYLPLYNEQTFEGLTEGMSPVFEQLGLTVEVPAFTATASFVSYAAQEAVILPEGAADKAEAWARLLANEPDNGDGTFTIREGMALIDLVLPEGFEVAEKDYDHVTFKRDDYRQITYTMSYITNEQVPGSGEYFLAQNDNAEERWATLGGGTVNREQIPVTTDTLTFTCDLLATTWQTGREDANFYAWSALSNDDVGTYYLYVEVTDGYSDGLGFTKSADITSDEFTAYLNAASPSRVTAE